MNLKDLMEKNIDVGELYSRLGDITELSAKILELEQELSEKEMIIVESLQEIPRDENDRLRVDLMNGTFLVINRANMIVIEVQR